MQYELKKHRGQVKINIVTESLHCCRTGVTLSRQGDGMTNLKCHSIGMMIVFACLSLAHAENRLAETRSILEKWVETRQLISKARSDWQSEKEFFQQTIQLYDRELQTLEAQISNLTTNSAQVDKERTEAESSLKASNEALDQSAQFAAGLEAQITRLSPQLPAPLQDLIKPLLNRIPSPDAKTRLSAPERTQTLVGILNELDKFNSAVTLSSQKLKNQKGEEVAVETVFLGLGAAYFVNEANDFAGVGMPAPEGWQWAPRPELATAVREVIRIYRNERPARFVLLPVNVK